MPGSLVSSLTLSGCRYMARWPWQFCLCYRAVWYWLIDRTTSTTIYSKSNLCSYAGRPAIEGMDRENGEPLRAGFISPQPQPLTRGCLASLMWNLGASNYYDESRECAPDKGAAPDTAQHDSHRSIRCRGQPP